MSSRGSEIVENGTDRRVAISAYWGELKEALDPVSLAYTRFAAVWHETDGERIVSGYAFGDRGIASLLNQAGHAFRRSPDPQAVEQIYRDIRRRQQEQDWTTRMRFPLRTPFRSPWKALGEGWYALRSQPNFPLHLTIVRKSAWFLWLEHAAVCENEAELAACLDRAKKAHRLRELTPASLSMPL